VKAGLTFQVLTTLSEIESSQTAWESLYAKSKHATIFTSFAWVTTWASVYQHTIEKLFIVTVNKAGVLVGVIPLYVRKVDTTTAWFISSGEPSQSETCSERQDLLGDESILASALDSLRDLMIEFGIKRLSLNNVSPSALITSWCSSSNIRYLTSKRGRRFYIPSECGRSKLEKKVRRGRRAAKNLNAKYIHVKSRDELQTAFASLKALNAKRWKEKGHPAIFDDLLFSQFHQEILNKLLDEQRLSLVMLEVEDQIIAVNYSIISGQDLIFYQNGIDTHFKPNISPGLLLHYEQLLLAKESGLSAYDFMMSTNADSYKRSITERSEAVLSLCIYSHSLPFLCSKMKRYLTMIIKRSMKGVVDDKI
jgi:CelD/BcsL family acetyltransferase involved in cellulose biosynthesis|tara:strand:+ start:1725 stop:2819 length:1095 start_codon:yes stop_codon:yes gene_type:complete